MRAIRDNIILKIEEEKESVIKLPEKYNSTKSTRTGIVLFIGPKVELEISVGDKVLMLNNYGHKIKDPVSEEEFLVIEEEFLLAKINE